MKKLAIALSTLLLAATISTAQNNVVPPPMPAPPIGNPSMMPGQPMMQGQPMIVNPQTGVFEMPGQMLDPNMGVPVAPPIQLDADKYIKFDNVNVDLKTVKEGDNVDVNYRFKNIGKEPIELLNVQASCGCTVPSFSREAILPGKYGEFKAIFNSKGKVGPINKSLTVTTKQGITKVITFSGNCIAASQLTDVKKTSLNATAKETATPTVKMVAPTRSTKKIRKQQK